MDAQPKTIYLKDYQPPAYWVETIDLTFNLEETQTEVSSLVTFRRNNTVAKADTPLVLQGEKLELQSLALDGRTLAKTDYTVDAQTLNIPNVPDKFSLLIKTKIHPEKNTELTGLYQASSLFCTQCEAEGFRRITYYPDRPDVMAKFTTKIIADKRRYPVLLSNGNCVEKGVVANDPNRHWVKWEDPFKKPCYLFALVAGDLMAVEDNFVTCSGRLVTLKLFIERENLDKTRHAMEALKKAMKWDEERYKREYDLDIYMIVAVNDFNMGAMENKGLNIFNSKYILASPETATDFDYHHIDAVVGHEYFHNWTGNRITCRDWFQLSLKEGLTVFREHHFSSEITGSPVCLIDNARLIRSRQFAEDAGPMSHPVRPESYMEINNFYTMTVYEKGAEVIRMLKTLLGWETFYKGMEVYFQRHDGEAATTDDFVAAMETASNRDLAQFRLWYSQAGTPEIEWQSKYDEQKKTFELTLKQSCPKTPGQPIKKSFHIPVMVGLLDKKGQDLLPKTAEVLELKEAEQTFHFSNIKEKPIVSLLRNFSAPVKIKTSLNDEQLAFLLAHDSDDFNRWEAGHKLTERVLLDLMEKYKARETLTLTETWLEAYRAVLMADLNPEFKASILSFPTVNELIEVMSVADIDAIQAARTFLKQIFAKTFQTLLFKTYESQNTPRLYAYTAESVAKRSLKNLCLQYLMLLEDKTALDICMKQYHGANNMTDKLGALSALSQRDCVERQEVLSDFYTRWQHEPLVVNKWFAVQAMSELEGTLDTVKALFKHPAFELTNPNKVYALIGSFSSGNPVCFHNKSGQGYTFLREVILKLDPLNPQVAARMINPFTRWKRFDDERQNKMKAELEEIKTQPKLSRDLFEIVDKSLAQG